MTELKKELDLIRNAQIDNANLSVHQHKTYTQSIKVGDDCFKAGWNNWRVRNTWRRKALCFFGIHKRVPYNEKSVNMWLAMNRLIMPGDVIPVLSEICIYCHKEWEL